MTTTTAALNEIRRSAQRQARIVESVDKMAQLEKELEKHLLTIQNVIEILQAGGYLMPPEGITEK